MRSIRIGLVVILAVALTVSGCRPKTQVPIPKPVCVIAVATPQGVPLDPTATITCDVASAPVGGTVSVTVTLSVPTTEAADCPAAIAYIALASGLSAVSASGDKGQITCTAPTVTSSGNPVVVSLVGTLPVIAVTLAIPAPVGNAYTIPLGALVRGGPAATIKIKATVL